MKIRRRSHPLNNTREVLCYERRMGRDYPSNLYNHKGILSHTSHFNGKKFVFVEAPL